MLSSFIENGLAAIDRKYKTHNGQSMVDKYKRIIDFLRAANQSQNCTGTHGSMNSLIRANKKPEESDKLYVGGLMHSDWLEKTSDEKKEFCDSFRKVFKVMLNR